MKRLVRSLLNALTLRPLPRPFARGAGRSWVVALPDLAGSANQYLLNNTDVCVCSPLVIYEDGVPLGPAHSPPVLVAEEGSGRFNHWYDRLIFSTSDNSDPNANGRSYRYSFSPRLFQRRAAGHAHPGWSGGRRDPRLFPAPEDWAGVASVTRLGLHVLAAARAYFGQAAGKTTLHLGPGWGYGSAMVLACYGLRPLVADRYLVPWDERYHRWYYGTVADELARIDPSVNVTRLRALAASGDYDGAGLRRFTWPPRDDDLTPGSVDLAYSDAILDHVEDLAGTCRHLARVVRPGGLGLHHLNCRDHRDPARPLEYLLLSEAEFAELFAQSYGECGHRRRPTEVIAQLQEAGFEVLGLDAEELTRQKYAKDLPPRLRAAAGSPYRELAPDDLRVLQGWCRVRKPAQEEKLPANV